MVYVQPSLLGWPPLVQSWAAALPATYSEHHRELLFALCDWLLPPALRLVTEYLEQPVKQQEQILVTSLLRIVAAELGQIFSPELTAPPAMKPSDADAAVQGKFLFALVWSLGASVNEAGRGEFDAQLRAYFDEKCASICAGIDCLLLALRDTAANSLFHSSWLAAVGTLLLRQIVYCAVSTHYLHAALSSHLCRARRYDDRVAIAVTHPAVKLLKPPPRDGSVFDYAYDLDSHGWRPWMDLMPPQKLTDDMPFEDITVLTLDVVRYTYLINTLVQSHQPVLLVGPTGTGKSVYTKNYLASRLDKEKWTYMTFGFSAQTSVNMTQARLALRGQHCPPAQLAAIAVVSGTQWHAAAWDMELAHALIESGQLRPAALLQS
jgi:dynein heavy chain, axonemal